MESVALLIFDISYFQEEEEELVVSWNTALSVSLLDFSDSSCWFKYFVFFLIS